MDELRLEFSASPTEEEINVLIDGVTVFNQNALETKERSAPLATFFRDASGNIVGGVAGRTIYRWFLITVVWVHTDYRGRGLGRKLMEEAESEARKRGCVGAQVDTLSLQAPDFYRKLGYEIVGHVPDFPAGYDRYYLSRRWD